MRFLLTCFFLLSVACGTAQTTDGFTLTELQPADLPYRMQRLSYEGVSRDAASPELCFSFDHTGAGIQVVRGVMMNGGKDPVTVSALGKVVLDPATGVPTGPATLQWVAPPGTGTNINIYPNTLSSSTMGSNKPLAKKGSVMSYLDFEAQADQLVYDKFYELPPYEPTVEKTEPNLVDSYARTDFSIGLSGGIQTITAINYTLRPEDERGKSLLGNANYKMKANFAKGTAKKVMKDMGISYKFLAGNIGQISDPATGNAVVLGGIKYKKDKSKDKSWFREFFLLGSDKEGNVTGQEKFETDEPMAVFATYPVGGKELAPGIFEAGTAVFLAKGDGDKDDAAVTPHRRYAFLVDVNAAKVLSRSQLDLPAGTNATIGTERNDDGDLVLLNYSAGTGQINPITVSTDGISLGEDRISANAELITGLPTDGLELRTTAAFKLADGRTMLLKKLANYTYDQFSRVTGSKDQAILATYLDADGKEIETKALMKATSLQPIARKGDRILFSSGQNFLELDLTTGDSKTAKAPVQLPAKGMKLYSEALSTFYALIPTPESTQVQLLSYRFE